MPVGLYVYPSDKTHVLLQRVPMGDYVLLTYDSSGNLLWVQTYDGTGVPWRSDGTAYALGVDGAGNVYVTGSSEGFYSGRDVTIVKYSADGRALWVRRYSADFNLYSLNEAGTAIAVTSAGDVYVTGWVRRTSSTVEWLVLKCNTRGNLLWVRRETHPGLPYGVGNNLNPRFALLDDAGNLYVVGDIDGVLVILKYDADGNRLWRVELAISGGTLQVSGAQVDQQGNVYVAGTGSSWYPYQYEFLAIKAPPDGAILWGGRDSWHLLHRIDAAVLDAYDNFWLAGTRQSEETGRQDCVLYQIISDGYWLRRIYYDSSPSMYDESVRIAADPFGNVVLAANSGYVTSGYTTTGAASDILLLKYGLVSDLTLHGRVHLGDVAMYPLVVPVELELRRYGDNEVTLFDFGLLVQAFGSTPDSPYWNLNADLDMDAEVTLFDFAVIVFNFGEIGDE